jgi:POT family proton-dependent oligopeptide transporter
MTEKADRFPSGIPFIVGNEAAERFSYYGMRAILYVYLVALYVRFVPETVLPAAQLAAERARATQVTHLFMAGVYAFPLLGAILADRLLGKYRTILFLSLFYCVGHGVLAVAGWQARVGNYEAAEGSMYAGLVLVAMGAGGIKPCVSANVGDQFSPANGHLLPRVYQIFYFSINFGSLFSQLLIPYLRDHAGAEVAFAVPGVLMGVATFIFWLGRKRFVRVPPSPGGNLGLYDAAVTALFFSPLFALILGYFVLWERWTPPAGTTATPGAFLLANLWLPLGTLGLVLTGVVLFRLRQRQQADTRSFLPVLVWSLTHQHLRKPGQSFFDPARAQFGQDAGDGPPAVLRIVLVFSMVSVFWALFDQHASTWIEQAGQMNLALTVPLWLGRYALGLVALFALIAAVWMTLYVSNRPPARRTTVTMLAILGALGVAAGIADLVGGQTASVRMSPAQLSALNPLFVMIIIPLLNVAVYGPLSRRGIEVSPLTRMTVGMFVAAASFVAAALLQAAIERQGAGRVHAIWQVIPYVLLTAAEVLVSVTGLEFAYSQAPWAMKSTVMSFWQLVVTMGNLLVAFLAPLQKTMALSGFFWLFAGLMAGAAAIFWVLARLYRGKTYLQEVA